MPLLKMLNTHRSGGPTLYNLGAVLNNGRYKIERKLNKGATAVVYAATDKQTGRSVALKVVQCGSNKVPVSVVRREVTLSSSVAHENMVQLLDVFAEGTELIIVWELIAGPDLLELLNEAKGRMNEPAAAFYFVQLLRGVLHMHAMGYCHRDIKPENCMVERSTQRLKLIDFGLSKHLESVATLGVGTPDYMPPEMVRSQIKQQRTQQQRQQQSQGVMSGAATAMRGLDGTPGRLPPHPLADQQQPPYDAKKVDAWAMGVVLYLLVTGTYPFEDPNQPNNLAATILNVQAGRCRPLPPHISAGCRGVIAELLNPDPEARTALEDLANSRWLVQHASAHAAQLGPLASRFDCSNPAWILPTNYTSVVPPTFTPAPAVAAGRINTGNNTQAPVTPTAAFVPGTPQNSGGSSGQFVTGSGHFAGGSGFRDSVGVSPGSFRDQGGVQSQQNHRGPSAAAATPAAAAAPAGAGGHPQPHNSALKFHNSQLQQQQQRMPLMKSALGASVAAADHQTTGFDQPAAAAAAAAAAAGGKGPAFTANDGNHANHDQFMDIDDPVQGPAAAAAGAAGGGGANGQGGFQFAHAPSAAAAAIGGHSSQVDGTKSNGDKRGITWLPSFMKKFK